MHVAELIRRWQHLLLDCKALWCAEKMHSNDGEPRNGLVGDRTPLTVSSWTSNGPCVARRNVQAKPVFARDFWALRVCTVRAYTEGGENKRRIFLLCNRQISMQVHMHYIRMKLGIWMLFSSVDVTLVTLPKDRMFVAKVRGYSSGPGPKEPRGILIGNKWIREVIIP